jgi:hypothetical protein
MKEEKLHKLPIRLPSAVGNCTMQWFMDQSPILDVLDLATQLCIVAKFILFVFSHLFRILLARY